MNKISVTLGGEKAIFSWKDGKVYTQGYDLESEKAVLALTGYGEGIGVLLIAINDCCKSEAEFMSEINAFVAGYKKILSNKQYAWPKGQLLFEYYSYSPDPDIRWGGLESASLSERHYKRLLAEKDTGIKSRMAHLRQLPEKYFHALLALPPSDINYFLAGNSNCPIDILEILAHDKDEYVRRRVAENPACPVSILELLYKDKKVEVRRCVAENTKCPVSLLELLAQAGEAGVRRSVSGNSSCTERILELLAQDEDSWVRQKVAQHPACPERIFEILAKDNNKAVRGLALRILAKRKEFVV